MKLSPTLQGSIPTLLLLKRPYRRHEGVDHSLEVKRWFYEEGISNEVYEAL
jgi:hypothetical protein